ncbi:hypothetical protein CAPTEDRAFT_188150 [Capitella teleta]|uniref:Uncharacterized protein n=1 Tax=Capitella teleta TaxID=283909 RepID=R7V0J9_CAPTE|nr:hypothetical protein CAPTEDRAFT_188150 [Capitella teleta]|eukprot:ELU12064.1 hypothetical protein CAPTEDRAFT_188150 [Capitella teleta]
MEEVVQLENVINAWPGSINEALKSEIETFEARNLYLKETHRSIMAIIIGYFFFKGYEIMRNRYFKHARQPHAFHFQKSVCMSRQFPNPALQRELSKSLLDREVKPGTIARQIGCDASEVRRLRQRVSETGPTTDRLRTGRPKVSTVRNSNGNGAWNKKNPQPTQLCKNSLTPASGMEIERWTLQRWRSVLFTGKGRICLVMSDRRRLVWRTWGEQFWDCCIQEQDGWGGASIMSLRQQKKHVDTLSVSSTTYKVAASYALIDVQASIDSPDEYKTQSHRVTQLCL